jgi:hypothetical protein
MSILVQARKDFKETFELNGIRSYEYDQEDYKGPCVVVLPHQRYLRRSGGTKTFGASWTVGLFIIVIGSKGQKPKNVDDLDRMIEKVTRLIENHCTIIEIGGPGQTTLNDGEYFGSVIEVEYNPINREE